MIKNIWNKLFNKDDVSQSYTYIVAQINDKVMPIDRGEIYEDPLDEFLKQKNYGEVSGGGTLLSKINEIEYCDVEIKLRGNEIDNQIINEIIAKLEEWGAPKGSKIKIENTGEEVGFGKLEGLAIYLDDVNLSNEVYKNSDAEAINSEIKELAKIKTDFIRYWHGNAESGLYFYGKSFNEMNNAIKNYIKSNPECENCRIVQIA